MKNLQKLKYSEEFRQILKVLIRNNISKSLLKLEDKLLFLDFNDITIIDNSNQVKVISSKNGNTINMRIGRMVTRLFKSLGLDFNNSELEEFANQYKSIAKFEETFKNFELVTGEDIRKYYHKDNYEEKRGVLGGSCMSSEGKQKYLDIYVDNTDKIALLILKNGSKIKGRAIVWKDIYMRRGPKGSCDKEVATLMDRIYTFDDSVTEQFKLYAKKMGWVYKWRQNSDSNGPFVLDNHKLPSDTKFFWYLDNIGQDYFPYLDTMVNYSLEKGFISNRKFVNSVKLTDTGGSYYND